MKNKFVLLSICFLLIFSCTSEKKENLICLDYDKSFEICIINNWILQKKSDYFLYAKLPNQNDFFAINYFDNPKGDQMFYDYLTGTHERFFYSELELLSYSIYEFVSDGFRYLYSTYEFNQLGEKVRYISITFNLNDVFYDVVVRINLDNPSEIENQFRKIVIPSIKVRGEKLFPLDAIPEKINEIKAEPLDSLLMK